MKKNIWKLLAAMLSLAVILSCSTVIIAAEDSDAVTVGTEADTKAPDEGTGAAGNETTAADGTTAASTTAAGTTAASTTGTSSSTSKNNSDSNHYGLITLIILAVIVVGIVIWVLRDRERALKLWRSFKSEFKKVVWADKHETLKNTILVIIAIIVFAAVIGLVDYLLSVLIVTVGKLI